MKVHYRELHGPTDWGWINLHNPILRVEDTNGIIAIDEEKNETIAAAIFDNWTHNSVQMHMVVTNPMVLRHEFLERIADYVFNAGQKKAIYALVPGDNDKALKLNKHLGMTEIVRLPEAYKDGIDYVVLEMKKENCKYLPALSEVA